MHNGGTCPAGQQLWQTHLEDGERAHTDLHFFCDKFPQTTELSSKRLRLKIKSILKYISLQKEPRSSSGRLWMASWRLCRDTLSAQ